MDIAMVFDGLQIGGIERVGTDYVKIMQDLGHEVTIINLRPEKNEMEKEFPNSCRIIHFEYPKKMAVSSYTWLLDKGMLRSLLYLVVYTLLSLINYAFKTYCRFFVCRNEFDILIAFSGHTNDLSFVSNNFIRNRKKLCWLHGALYSYILMARGYLNEYKKIKNLVVLVDDAQEEVLAYHRDLNLNINKMYNPTSITNKKVESKNVDELKQKYGKFALMVSRFSYPHKDQYTVVEAIRIVREKYNDDMNLVFVGDGPEEEKVKDIVQGFKDDIRKSIFFEGVKNNVQDYYNAAYCLVHASVAGEGLPTIILEALAYGLPTIVTDSKTGPREILGDSEYGMLCKVQNPEDMAEKIHRLINDGKLYAHYKCEGEKRIKDFSPEVIQAKLENILSDLI